MPITIASNIAAFSVQRRLSQATDGVRLSSERLASGLRINHARDDAAGLAISSDLKIDSRISNQGIRNFNDGLSALSVIDGSLQELSKILTRQLELAEQAANGVYSTAQRMQLDRESRALTDEYNRIIRTTSFNNLDILSVNTETIVLQGGYGTNGQIAVGMGETLETNFGTGQFNTAVNLATNSSSGGPLDVITGDFNRDGYADLLVHLGGTAGVDVFLANGDGTFLAPVSYAAASDSVGALATGDFNGDDILDFIDFRAFANQAVVYFGNGNGTFKDRVSFAVANNGGSDEVADFNGDGLDDFLYLSTSGGTAGVFIHLSNGNGSFSLAATFDPGTHHRDAGTGDFNEDGKTDIVTNDGTIFIANGDGTFRAPVNYPNPGAGTVGADKAIGDINNDGHLDIIVGSTTGSAGVLLGNGNGTFSLGSVISPDVLTQPELVDFNSDGNLDLVAGSSTTNSIRVLLGNGNGTFQASTSYLGGTTPSTVTVADFNGDGVKDVAAGNSGSFNVSFFFGQFAPDNTVAYLDLKTASAARDSLTSAKAQLTKVNSAIGAVGSQQSRLNVAINTLQTSSLNYQSAESQITSADIADEAAQLVKTQILQQTASAILAQANLIPQLALNLLRS